MTGSAPQAATTTVLSETAARIDAISKTYPGTKALSNVSFSFTDGKINALLGGNGSGKSTLIKILAGVETSDAGGQIHVGGITVDAHKSHPALAHELGFRFVHQDPGFFGELTVAENLALGQGFMGSAFKIDWSAQQRRATELLDRFQINASPTAQLLTLRPADRTMVAVARALQDADEGGQRIVVLDEPTASLPDQEVDRLLAALRRLGAEGQTIVYVSHRLDEIIGFADTVTVLRDGKLVDSLPAVGLDRNDLIEMIVGRSVNFEGHDSVTVDEVSPVLSISGLAGGPLTDVSLEVGSGEIVGLAGLLGSGRTELLRMIFGETKPEAGAIRLDGEVMGFRSTSDAMAASIAHVPEDRLGEAMFADLSIRENFSAAQVRNYWHSFKLDKGAERRDANDSITKFTVKAHSADPPISTLSGGNQQKVILGRWLRTEPRLLLLDEPTQGVDVGAREEIYDLLRTHTRSGTGVLVASSDFEELVAICDRVLVLVDGRIQHTVSGADLNPSLLATLAYSEKDDS